jgi:hypothetical protein
MCVNSTMFAAYIVVSLSYSIKFFFFLFFYHCTYGCMFCVPLFNFINYMFFLYILIAIFMYFYFYVCFVLGVLLHCFILCILWMVMCTVLLPPGINPIAVNKYIISYLVTIMVAYYLEGFQCLTVPSSESAPRRGPLTGRLHIQHCAVIADTWAARRDVKPGTSQVEALRTVQ